VSAEEEGEVQAKCSLEAIPVGDTIKISDSLNFEFIRTATPRWPDMVNIYLPERRIMFSSKLFSAHVAAILTEVKVRFPSLEMVSNIE